MSSSVTMRPTTSGTTTSSDMKKKGSLRALFSIFRHKSSSTSDLATYPNDVHNSAASSVSTTFLPPEIQLPPENAPENATASSHRGSTASTASLSTEVSTFSRSPSTSSASTLSMDNGSDTSTPMTTPSNSSPNILMKATDSSGEVAAPEVMNPGRQRALEALSNRQPSRLSPVSNLPNRSYHAPTSLYLGEESEEVGEQKSKRRKSAIGRMLRRAKSNPDFIDPADDEHASPHPQMSRIVPHGRPLSIASTGSHYSGLSRRLSRRGSTKGIPGLDKDLIPDPVREREEHLLILGADPMGSSFYLYPTSKQEVINRRKSTHSPSSNSLQPNRYSVNSDDKRRAWSGAQYDSASGHSMSSSGRRPRSGIRPGSFRPTVANQVILEEGNESAEGPWAPMNYRRHSALPGQYDSWRPARADSLMRQGPQPVRSGSAPVPSHTTPTISISVA
ncbi:hypothetical protein EX30DRAFT_366442 [Ascodesmis nigricans]|uniref:Uncharacterized protein n=1 Tax=Ascodesmis nigricans TaxID=341454 RepID=A0A4S2MRN0_9PEZI|nr:hypothetical protein EX30DRAFT_366442 [Ascodesmis nigricans]